MQKEATRIETGVTAGVKRLEAKRPALDWSERELAVLRWYAITTIPGYEATIEEWLERRGLVAIVPMHQVFRSPNMHVKKKRPVRFPLLPRYLFVGFGGVRDEWDVVFGFNIWLGSRVVTGIIGTPDGHAWRMDGAKVARWLRVNGMVRADDAEQHMRTHKEFAVGDAVEIAEGPMTGVVGEVVQMTAGEARVLIPLFGTTHEVRVPLANLEKSA